MKRKTFAANWKMNKTVRDAESFCLELLNVPQSWDDCDLVVFPPFTCLSAVQGTLAGRGFTWGAQNVYPKESGAFTGEISPPMLSDLGCTWVLIGHSERRHVLKEPDEFIAAKVAAVLAQGLRPNLCVGETLAERQAGKASDRVLTQLRSGVAPADATRARTMAVSYEPVWAIGTGQNATADQAQEMCGLIREELARLYGSEVSREIPILYGGSVNPTNIAVFTGMPDVDGALIGGASLKVGSFVEIALRGVGRWQG